MLLWICTSSLWFLLHSSTYTSSYWLFWCRPTDWLGWLDCRISCKTVDYHVCLNYMFTLPIITLQLVSTMAACSRSSGWVTGTGWQLPRNTPPLVQVAYSEVGITSSSIDSYRAHSQKHLLTISQRRRCIPRWLDVNILNQLITLWIAWHSVCSYLTFIKIGSTRQNVSQSNSSSC